MKWNFVFAGIAALLTIGLIGFAYLHFHELAVLYPQGPIALQERNVIYITVALAAIVVIPVFVILFVFGWRYRAEGPLAKEKHAPNWDHDSWLAEVVWWMVPTIILVFLSFVSWKSSHELDPYVPITSQNAPLEVQVIALDWKWLFIYPQQGIATVNYLEIPENVPVHFDITSDAPMNSFWIPSLGGQIMAMPGMKTRLNLMASHTGTFDGLSGNISGDGFAGMNFKVKSVSVDDFTMWVAGIKNGSNALSTTTYVELEKPSEYNPATFYSSIGNGIFDASIMKYMMQMQAQGTSTQSQGSGSMQGMDMSGM